jgi:quaternary ammonium compound-resistance protein SugE
MSWIYLILAGILEFGWPVGFKLAQIPESRIIGMFMSVVCMAFSGYFLYLAQKTIPMSIAYAIWTVIGTAGTFIIGVTVFKENINFLNCLGFMMVIIGAVLLKMGA